MIVLVHYSLTLLTFSAAVIFAVNLFFAQRIVRAMHPKIGWNPLFKVVSYFFIWTVPAIIIFNIVSISVSFFSTDNPTRLETTEKMLKFGASWNVALVSMPLLWVLLAGFLPGRKPEPFGTGHLRFKISLLCYSAVSLLAGAAIRLAVAGNPAMPGMETIIFRKATFYTTGFMLEFLVVVAYAVVRIDQLFYVPDGSSKPGDYSAASAAAAVAGRKSIGSLQPDIEEQLRLLGLSYEPIGVPLELEGSTKEGGAKKEVAFARLWRLSADEKPPSDVAALTGGNPAISAPLPRRVSRRQTIVEAVNSTRAGIRNSTMSFQSPVTGGAYVPPRIFPSRPSRMSRQGTFVTGEDPNTPNSYDEKTVQYTEEQAYPRAMR